MSDAKLRELERRWKETGAVEDEAAYLLERVRVGELTQERLELAAYCGHDGAKRAIPSDRPFTRDHVRSADTPLYYHVRLWALALGDICAPSDRVQVAACVIAVLADQAALPSEAISSFERLLASRPPWSAPRTAAKALQSAVARARAPRQQPLVDNVKEELARRLLDAAMSRPRGGRDDATETSASS